VSVQSLVDLDNLLGLETITGENAENPEAGLESVRKIMKILRE